MKNSYHFFFAASICIVLLMTQCRKKDSELPQAPVVQTESIVISPPAVTLINDTSAFATALVSKGGSYPIISNGFCWDTVPLPTTASSLSVNSPTVGQLSGSLHNLVGHKVYFLRAFVTNTEGTFYSEVTRLITGKGWSKLNSTLIHPAAINDVEVCGDSLYMATQNGVLFSPDTGNTWQNIGLAGKSISSISHFGGTIYAGCSPYVYISDNNGASWMQSHAMPFANSQYWVGKIAFSQDRIFAIATFYAYVSSDGGDTWSRLTNGIGNLQVPLVGLAALQSTLVILTNYGSPFFSIDSGDSWSGASYAPMAGSQAYGLQIMANRFYVPQNGSPGYTSVNGDTWEQATLFPVNPAAVFSRNAEIFIYGYPNGVSSFYLSTNNGQSWSAIGFSGIEAAFPTQLFTTPHCLLALSPDGLFRHYR